MAATTATATTTTTTTTADSDDDDSDSDSDGELNPHLGATPDRADVPVGSRCTAAASNQASKAHHRPALL